MKKRNFNIVRHPKVKNDLQEAIDYYNNKQKGLGDKFYFIAKKEKKALIFDASYRKSIIFICIRTYSC